MMVRTIENQNWLHDEVAFHSVCCLKTNKTVDDCDNGHSLITYSPGDVKCISLGGLLEAASGFTTWSNEHDSSRTY